MAGYSGTPLPKKLGVKPGHHLGVVGRPDGWDALGPLDDVAVDDGGAPPYDVLLWFGTSRAALEASFVDLAGRIRKDGGLWICWPKKASKRPTDLTEDVLREIGLPHGLVDNKVCAVDDVWSGLRFVWRKENR